MKGYLTLWRAFPSLLSFGLLLTFFSSFGQTFLISLFVPDFIQDFGLSNAKFGSFYGLATLGSALFLTYLGRQIDHVPLYRYAAVVALGLAVALVVTATATHVAQLLVGLFGLRLAGQGLMSHTAHTTMARYFDRDRGKALSLTAMGHSLGEGLLPMLMAVLLTQVAWRTALLGAAVLVLAVVQPYVWGIIRQYQFPPLPTPTSADTAREWTPRQVVRDRRFWLILPQSFVQPFLITALIFFQLPLADSRGWTPEWMAISFSAFAAVSLLGTLLAGPLIDRFRAVRLFPYFVLPFGAGVGVLLASSHPWAAPVYLALAGLANGLGGAIRSAVQAELYGVRSLGAVRSIFTMLMVVSTAVGPTLYGSLLDVGWSFDQLLYLSLGVLAASFGYSFRLYPAYTWRRWRVRWRQWT